MIKGLEKTVGMLARAAWGRGEVEEESSMTSKHGQLQKETSCAGTAEGLWGRGKKERLESERCLG